MTRILTLIVLFFYNCSFGQTENKRDCKIEFYLLKTLKPNLDTTKELRGEFLVINNDLVDTAFVKDFEIFSYSISKDTTKSSHSQNINEERHKFRVNSKATQRINNLNISLCCGRQFALVVNGQIAYAGYFWNLRSSFGSDWTTAFSYDSYIDILRKLPDYDFVIDSNDRRRNESLFKCLAETNRMTKK